MQKTALGRNAMIMGGMTFVSRLTGFIRTWSFALAFGNTLLNSSYQIANTLPNMIYELVAGGLLSTAFLPIFLDQVELYGQKRGGEYVSAVLKIILLSLSVVSIVAILFAQPIIKTQMFRNPTADLGIAVLFFRIFAFQILFYGVGAIFSGVLNANRKYLFPAIAPVINNVIVIVTVLLSIPISKSNPDFSLLWIAGGTTLGVVGMVLVQLPALINIGMKFDLRAAIQTEGLKETLHLALPAVAFTISNLIAVSFRNAYVGGLSDQAVSTLYFAWTWFQLPYGVIAVALSTATFTELSLFASKKAWRSFKLQFMKGLRITLFFMIPITILLVLLSRPLVMTFKFGKFTLSDVEVVSNILSWLAITLPFFSAYMFTYFTFSAMKHLKTVAIVNFFATGVQVFLYATLILGISSWKGLGLTGVAIANLVFYIAMLSILLFLLRKKIGSFDFSSFLLDMGKILVASLCAGVVVWSLLEFLFGWGGTNTGYSLMTILICGVVGLSIAWGLSAVLKVPEALSLRDSQINNLLKFLHVRK